MIALVPAAPPEPIDAPSGLPGLERLSWGTHLCQFYRTAEDLASLLVPYFSAGLANEERCLWIAASPLRGAEAIEALRHAVPDVDARIRRGQLEVLNYEDWYRKSAKLSTEEILRQWLAREEAALREGYRGLRITGNTSFLRPEDWEDFEAYERQVHGAFASRRVLAVCSYSLEGCTAGQVLDVVRHHGVALVRRSGAWAELRGSTETLGAVTEAAAARPGVGPAAELGEKHDQGEAASRDECTHVSRLQRVTSALLSARSAAEFARVVATTMTKATGADRALIASAGADGGLTLVAQTGCPAVANGTAPIALAPTSPLAEVVRTGRPIVAGERGAVEARWPEAPRGVEALAAVPLETGGVRLGVLAFGFAKPQPFSPVDRALLDDLARQAAIALERARLLDDLEHARERAETACRTKDEFLAMLGHELRNPLSPMVAVLHLMQRRAPDAFRKEREILERQLRHMEHLVNDLLDVSRIVRGKLALQTESIELGRIVADAVEAAAPLLEARGHELRVDVPATGLALDADPHRLVQAVLNLLSNAAKYTPAGGHVTISAARRGESAVLTVEDDGQGIEPELTPDVFDLFVQGPRGIERSEGGLGLGLAIARSVIDLHGGTIRVRSEGRGKGSTFTIELPLRAQRDQPAPHAARSRPAPSGGSRVLVVDDNVDAAETLADALRFLGHEVATAHDPAGALHAAAGLAPDIAVLDIGLPEVDGWTLGARLREGNSARPPHCIAVTGYGMETDRARSREAGFVAHLVKPVDLDRLGQIVSGLAAAGQTAAEP